MDTITLVQIIAILIFCYTLYGAIYRLYLSPIASFPGPKLAALTFGYEFYYDIIKNGRYTFKITDLHKQYGPIIRINPYEIHVIDPEFYDELYVSYGKRRTELWSWTVSFRQPRAWLKFLSWAEMAPWLMLIPGPHVWDVRSHRSHHRP